MPTKKLLVHALQQCVLKKHQPFMLGVTMKQGLHTDRNFTCRPGMKPSRALGQVPRHFLNDRQAQEFRQGADSELAHHIRPPQLDGTGRDP